jgi:hypothetical protein
LNLSEGSPERFLPDAQAHAELREDNLIAVHARKHDSPGGNSNRGIGCHRKSSFNTRLKRWVQPGVHFVGGSPAGKPIGTDP